MSASLPDILLQLDLWALLVEPFAEFGFMRRALAGCLALSVSAAPMGVFLMLFGMLTVEIDESHLRFRFGIGLIRKRIPLAEIVEARPVRTTWADGWGIHYTARGWLYNVSGWDAVEITLASGQRLRLGTDEPQRLTQALLATRVFRSPVRGAIR